MRVLPADHRAFSYEGAISTPVDAHGVRVLRYPAHERDLFDAGLRLQASSPSGVRLAFVSDTASLRVRCRPARVTTYCDYDLFVDGKLAGTQRFAPQVSKPDFRSLEEEAEFHRAQAKVAPRSHVVAFGGLEARPAGSLFELWLSNVGPQHVQSVEIEEGCSVSRHVDRRPKWICHGSSITHGMADDIGNPAGSAESPCKTWPATAARLADVNLTSLGYGGMCHMDQSVARMIRDGRADAITLKLGINVHNLSSMSLRTFQQAALGFIRTIRDGHPTTPIMVVSPIYGSWREDFTANLQGDRRKPGTAKNELLPNLKEMRRELEAAVAILRGLGDANLHYVSGLDLFSRADADAGLLPDALHPNSVGYQLIGQRMAQIAFGPGGLLLPGRVPVASSKL